MIHLLYVALDGTELAEGWGISVEEADSLREFRGYFVLFIRDQAE